MSAPRSEAAQPNAPKRLIPASASTNATRRPPVPKLPWERHVYSSKFINLRSSARSGMLAARPTAPSRLTRPTREHPKPSRMRDGFPERQSVIGLPRPTDGKCKSRQAHPRAIRSGPEGQWKLASYKMAGEKAKMHSVPAGRRDTTSYTRPLGNRAGVCFGDALVFTDSHYLRSPARRNSRQFVSVGSGRWHSLSRS